MSSSGSVAGRAPLAVGLMIGFYTLAITIAVVLIALPIMEIVYVHRIELRLGFFAIVGGGTILWSILPRWDLCLAKTRSAPRNDEAEDGRRRARALIVSGLGSEMRDSRKRTRRDRWRGHTIAACIDPRFNGRTGSQAASRHS